VTRQATVLAALAAADAAEAKGDLTRAAELLRQVETNLQMDPGRTLQGLPAAHAVDAYTRRLVEPRSRRRA
jgi:hypothetical protein